MTRVCNNCGVELKPMEAVEINLKHRRQITRVCSHECRNEWWLGYAAEVQEQLEDIEMQEGIENE